MNTKANSDAYLLKGTIYTAEDVHPVVESMVVQGGKITALGSFADLFREFPDLPVIDHGEQFIYPGFIDPHCHFLGYGRALQQADLRGADSIEEVIKRLKIHREKYPSASWLLGRGWDQNLWGIDSYPSKADLDSHFPDTPVYLIRIDGHAAWVNQCTLDLVGLDDNSDFDDQLLLRDNGGLKGILIDEAMHVAQPHLPEPDEASDRQALLDAQSNCFAVGLTSVMDCGLPRSSIELINDLHQSGELQMHTNIMVTGTDEASLDHFLERGPWITDRMNVRSVKFYADGALGSRGARLLEPYSDDADNKGAFIHSGSYLEEQFKRIKNAGFQVCTHAIGDGAVRLLLDVYERVLEPNNDCRWRIEHAQIVHPEDMDRFGARNIIPSVQSTHATSDMYWAGNRLGLERLQRAYRLKDLLAQNGWLPNGSDFPIERINPLLGFFAAVARQDEHGWPEDGFQIDQALTREEAFKAMTIWAAKANFDEEKRGSLKAGKQADFIILKDDLMRLPLLEIPRQQVVRTYVNGQQVY